jgi:hypothetical protein
MLLTTIRRFRVAGKHSNAPAPPPAAMTGSAPSQLPDGEAPAAQLISGIALGRSSWPAGPDAQRHRRPDPAAWPAVPVTPSTGRLKPPQSYRCLCQRRPGREPARELARGRTSTCDTGAGKPVFTIVRHNKETTRANRATNLC